MLVQAPLCMCVSGTIDPFTRANGKPKRNIDDIWYCDSHLNVLWPTYVRSCLYTIDGCDSNEVMQKVRLSCRRRGPRPRIKLAVNDPGRKV